MTEHTATDSTSPEEGTTMTENQLPTAPGATTTDAAPEGATSPVDQPAGHVWRDRLPSGRKAVAAGAVVAGLAIGGAGFGAGYAVGHGGADDAATTQTTGTDWGDRGMPGDRGPMGDMGGQLPGQTGGGPMGGTTQGDGSTGQAPDFDGDGQPDTDSGTDSGSTSDSATQNS
jgi:hypothetical protein